LIDQCLARKWPRGLRILNLSYHGKVMGIGSQSLFLSFIIVTGVTMAPYQINFQGFTRLIGQNATIILHALIRMSLSTYIVRVYNVDSSYETYSMKFQVYVSVN